MGNSVNKNRRNHGWRTDKQTSLRFQYTISIENRLKPSEKIIFFPKGLYSQDAARPKFHCQLQDYLSMSLKDGGALKPIDKRSY